LTTRRSARSGRRAGRNRALRLAYRVQFPNPDNALASRSGALIAQRVSRDANPESMASGHEQFNVLVTIRRAGRR
jgi:hypothetical protein